MKNPNKTRSGKKGLSVKLLSGAISLAVTAMSGMPAQANPTGGQVVQGNAVINQTSATRMDINQASDKAVINWQGFSIGGGEQVNFNQPSRSAVALNRITGGSISSIQGKLSANGNIFLINPNGVVFGKGSVVDVSGLLATTSNISDQDFMAGRMKFSGSATGSIVNEGEINIQQGGLVAFVAPSVRNSGVINARLGRVALVSGKSFTVDLYGDGLVSLAVDDSVAKSLVQNSGTINADGGQVQISAEAAKNIVDNVINMDGIVLARSVSGQRGRIVLNGGNGAVNVSGTLDATGGNGSIDVLGGDLTVASGATVDVSGSGGAGEIHIGGDYQGKGSRKRATFTRIQPGANVLADAGNSGNGGRIIVWSDKATQVDGNVSARGGASGGDGGFVETSSAGTLDFTTSVDVSAANGAPGTWLLDPEDITIGRGQADGIENTLNQGGNVSIQTHDGGSGKGNINVNASITKTQGGDAGLSMTAHNDINVNAPISSQEGKLNVSLTAGNAVNVNAGVNTNGGSFGTRVTGVKPAAGDSNQQDQNTRDDKSTDNSGGGSRTDSGQAEDKQTDNQSVAGTDRKTDNGANDTSNSVPDNTAANASQQASDTTNSQPQSTPPKTPPAPTTAPRVADSAPAQPTPATNAQSAPASASPAANPASAVDTAPATPEPPQPTAVASNAPEPAPAQQPATKETKPVTAQETRNAGHSTQPVPSTRSGVALNANVTTGGGDISVDAGEKGTATISAKMDSSNTESGEKGGDIQITGQNVVLDDSAELDASGDAGGGDVQVGGGYQGKGDLRNAENTTVSQGATIRSDATNKGDAGQVVVWSDDTTHYQGHISAQGGAKGGDGGQVEVSGKQNLAFNGTVDATAANGKQGSLLLDPTTLNVGGSATVNDVNQLSWSQITSLGDIDLILRTSNDLHIGDMATDRTVVEQGGDLGLNKKRTLAFLSDNGSIIFDDTNDTLATKGGNLQFTAKKGNLTLGVLETKNINAEGNSIATYKKGGGILLEAGNNTTITRAATDGGALYSKSGGDFKVTEDGAKVGIDLATGLIEKGTGEVVSSSVINGSQILSGKTYIEADSIYVGGISKVMDPSYNSYPDIPIKSGGVLSSDITLLSNGSDDSITGVFAHPPVTNGVFTNQSLVINRKKITGINAHGGEAKVIKGNQNGIGLTDSFTYVAVSDSTTQFSVPAATGFPKPLSVDEPTPSPRRGPALGFIPSAPRQTASNTTPPTEVISPPTVASVADSSTEADRLRVAGLNEQAAQGECSNRDHLAWLRFGLRSAAEVADLGRGNGVPGEDVFGEDSCYGVTDE